jgi:hypothetical protein
MPTAQEVQEKAPKWLKAAHSKSNNVWAVSVLPLDTLKPLHIDKEEGGYQRPLSQLRVQDLTERFDGGEAREIYVSQREDGSRWILDGQHTWATLKNVGISDWPCRVFFNLTPAEEARRFAEYNNNTRRVPPVVQYNAEVLAGDNVAVALEKILSAYQLRISSSKLRSKEGYLGVASRAVFQKLYELGGQKLLEETLQLSIDAWGQKPNSFLGRMLQGLGYLLHYSEGEFDRKRMLAVLENTTPRQIVEAVGATGSGGAARRGADHVIDLYINGVGAEFSALRRNAKETPKLPRTTPKSVEPHEYWTEESVAIGRRKIETYQPPAPEPKAPKAPKPPKAATEAPKDPTEASKEGDVDLSQAEGNIESTGAAEDGDVDFDAISTSGETPSGEDGWEYQAPEGSTGEAESA